MPARACLFHRQAGEAATQHIEGMVGGEILNPVAAAISQLQLPAERSLRRSQSHIDQPHGVAPFVGIRPTPVTDKPMSAPVIRRAFSAMEQAHGSDTAPYVSSSSRGTPSTPAFTSVQ